MKKTIFSLFLLNSLLFSNDFSYLDIKEQPINESLQKLDKNTDVSKYNYLNQKPDMVKQMNLMKNAYQGDDFLTTEEFNKVADAITNIKKIHNNGKREFILYFTSTSVPDETLFNVLFSVGILQDNGINIDAKHYYTGFPEEFKDYMFSMKDKLENKPIQEKSKITQNFHLKIDPRMFYHFKLEKVPAIALAECTTENPEVDKCEFKYLIRGDVSLINFFDKISADDSKYQKYYDVLKANKIVSAEDYNEKK